MNKKDLVGWINSLITSNELWRFYSSKYWIKLSREVLKEQHYECQECLKKGILTKANTVHHVNFLKDRPDLALSKYFIDDQGHKQKQLIAICFNCHNKVHNRFIKQEPLNEERW